MKKLLLALLLLAFCGTAHAQSTCPGASTADAAYGREVLTISSTALPFTVANYADGAGNVKYAYVRLETNNIRISVDGIVPTATVGQLIETGANVGFWVCGQVNVQRFRAIRTTSDAALTVQYYR